MVGLDPQAVPDGFAPPPLVAALDRAVSALATVALGGLALRHARFAGLAGASGRGPGRNRA